VSLPRADVTISWPAPTLPGVCVRTGLATRDGVVLTPRGATYDGAEVIVPFSSAAQLRMRALRRLAVIAGLATIGLALAGAVSAVFLFAPAAVAAAICAYATREARSFGIHPVLNGRELLIPGAHPAFAEAIASRPERCGGASAGGGCETCLSGCLPQAVAV
jgi:hypothetical protein